MATIQNIILNNTKARYLLELEYTDDETIKKEIMNIIARLDKPMENKLEKFNNKINEVELMSMKKQFFRLKAPQKQIVIEKYFIGKNISSDKAKSYAETIMQFIIEDSLKNKDIEYDIDNATVTNIHKIEFDEDSIKVVKKVKAAKTTKTKSKAKKTESDEEEDDD